MLCLLPPLLAPAAHAGHYSGPIYSGGKATDGDGTQTDYNTSGRYGYGGSAEGDNNWFGTGRGGPATCSGTITAKFHWEADYPGEPPPQQVVVHETVTAGYGDVHMPEGDDTPRGQCDVVYPAPEVDYTGDPPWEERRKSVEHYKAQDGKADVEVVCSPSATGAEWDDTDSWTCFVGYSADIAPVTIQLTGTTLDSSSGENILVGQGCYASMSAGPATLSNFQWSVSGETFASFEQGMTPGSMLENPHAYGHMNPVDSSEYQKPDPHWYWRQGMAQQDANGQAHGQLETVSCTAQASANGQVIGSVTAKKDVYVWKPYHSFSPHAGGADISGDGTSSSAVTGDIQFAGSVGTPDLFTSYWGDCGIWQPTQLISVNRTRTTYSQVTVPETTNGLVLDSEFNYGSIFSPPSPWPADSTEDAPDEQSWSDAPEHRLDYAIAGTVADNFNTYMFYQPPGSDVQWVPLHLCVWTWQVSVGRTCSFDYNGFTWGPWTPKPPGTVSVYNDSETSTFPSWTEKYTP